MIAALPMYAFAWTAEAEARLWEGIAGRLREAGIDAPAHLSRVEGDFLDHWTDPDLLLSQTCGRPYKRHLHGRVNLVGTPDFAVEDCPPGYYRSLVVARADDPRETLHDFATAVFAFNEAGSQSGYAALATEAPEVLAGPRLRTGGHRASVEAVGRGEADFASIDAVTFRLLSASSATEGLKVIHATTPRPGLPLITNLRQDPAPLHAAVSAAILALAPADRETLGLRGLVRIPAEDYLALPDP